MKKIILIFEKKSEIILAYGTFQGTHEFPKKFSQFRQAIWSAITNIHVVRTYINKYIHFIHLYYLLNYYLDVNCQLNKIVIEQDNSDKPSIYQKCY